MKCLLIGLFFGTLSNASPSFTSHPKEIFAYHDSQVKFIFSNIPSSKNFDLYFLDEKKIPAKKVSMQIVNEHHTELKASLQPKKVGPIYLGLVDQDGKVCFEYSLGVKKNLNFIDTLKIIYFKIFKNNS